MIKMENKEQKLERLIIYLEKLKEKQESEIKELKEINKNWEEDWGLLTMNRKEFLSNFKWVQKEISFLREETSKWAAKYHELRRLEKGGRL